MGVVIGKHLRLARYTTIDPKSLCDTLQLLSHTFFSLCLAPSKRTNDARNENSKSIETAKAPSMNTRTKVLETPIKSNVDLSSKLKATKSTKDTAATNNSKGNKKTDKKKQEVPKVVKGT